MKSPLWYLLPIFSQKLISQASPTRNCIRARQQLIRKINGVPLGKSTCNYNNCRFKCRKDDQYLQFTNGQVSEKNETFTIYCYTKQSDKTASWYFENYPNTEPIRCGYDKRRFNLLNNVLQTALEQDQRTTTLRHKRKVNDKEVSIERNIFSTMYSLNHDYKIVENLHVNDTAVFNYQPAFNFPFTVKDDSESNYWPDELNQCDKIKLRSNYHMKLCLEKIQQFCPNVTSLENVGKSTEGNFIKALVFKTDAGKEFARRKIQVGLFANMHGNEASGRELLLWLVKHLCKHSTFTIADTQHTLPIVKTILDKMDLYVMPTINPDGFRKRHESQEQRDYYFTNPNRRRKDMEQLSGNWVKGRYLANTIGDPVDMNRDFPSFNSMLYNNASSNEELLENLKASQIFNVTYFSEYEADIKKLDISDYERFLQTTADPAKSIADILKSQRTVYSPQPETLAISKFLDENILDFAINFHDGAKVVNYPLDGGLQGNHVYTRAPDDELFQDIAKIWTYNNPKFMSQTCGDGNQFPYSVWPNGITNGAEWYSVTGGLQDYNYIKHGTMHLTIEMSCDKFSHDFHVQKLVKRNKKAMLYWLYYLTNIPNVSTDYNENIFSGYEPLSTVKLVLLKFNPETYTYQETNDYYWTVTDRDGHFRKYLPKFGKYNLYVNGALIREVNFYNGDNIPV